MSYFGVSTRNGVGLGLGTVPSLTNTPLGYRLAPSLDLSFAGSDTLDPRITFSRTTNATLTNSAGLVANAPMNLLTFSEQFDNAAWVKGGVTITANATASPDGTTTADRYVESALNEVHSISSISVTAASGATYTLSVYAKNAGRFLRLILPAGTFGVAVSANFDLVNGIAYDTAGSGAVIQSVGNGWYRCSICVTATTGATGTISVSSAATSSGTGSYTGDGISGVYIWGAQLEVGSTATTYNPTTVKNLLGFTENFDNAAWTKSNAFVQTNLLTYSQDFDNAAWTKTAATVTANVVVAPDGTTTADKAVADTTNSTHAVERTDTFTGTRTFSVYAKQAEYSVVFLRISGVTNANATFDLSNGTVSSGAGATGVILDSGNGWYRCSITYTAAGVANPQIFINGNNTSPYTGDGTSGIYIWGAQLVQGTSAGDYKATYAAAAAVGYTDIYGQPFAQKLVPDATSNNHWVFQSVTTTAAPYTATVYMKAGEYSWGLLRLRDSVGDRFAWFNLATGVVGTVQTNLTATITSVGNGWYRCSATIASAIAGTNPVVIGAVSADNTTVYTGDGTSGIYIFGAQLSDSASVDPYVYNPVAVPTAQAYYGPRFDYDPVTLAPKGLLIEEQRTNLLLNSAVLNTQVVTTTATAHTLSFYGTGTIVLSGASTGTVVGTGAYPTRTTLTFTPIVGVLTVTVTGSVTMAQLEAGAFATSYIPTVASQVTRAADSASMIGNNFARWYNVNEGTLYLESSAAGGVAGAAFSFQNDAVSNDAIWVQSDTRSNGYDGAIRTASGFSAAFGYPLAEAAGTMSKRALAYKVNDFALSKNGTTALTDTAGPLPSALVRMQLGSPSVATYTGAVTSGAIKRIAYYNRRLSNTELQGITS